MTHKKGDRVRLTYRAEMAGVRLMRGVKLGIVLHDQDGLRVTVQPDGYKAGHTFHCDFWTRDAPEGAKESRG